MAGSDVVAEQFETLTPDLCVIGGGAAGLAVAMAASLFGVPVVLIERARLGGDRSQAVISILGALATRHDGPATEAADTFIHDHLQRALDRRDRDHSRERLTALGVRVIDGEACFVSRSTVRVGSYRIKARRFVIATGATRRNGERGISPAALADRISLPDRPVIIGNGAAAVELAQALQRLGRSVTLRMPEPLLPKEDPEAVSLLRRQLLRDGVTLVEDAGQEADIGEGAEIIDTRRQAAAVASLDLELAGIEAEEDGIRVDRSMRTRNRRVFAVGDCVAGADRDGDDAHLASHQAGIVLRRSLFRMPATTQQRTIRMISTQPAIAATGLSEARAREQVRDISVLRWPYADLARAHEAGDGDGFVKLVTDRKGQLLGATVTGARAGELIALLDLSIARKLGMKDVAELVVPHASYADVVRRAALSFRTPLAHRPSVRRLIGFLRRFG